MAKKVSFGKKVYEKKADDWVKGNSGTPTSIRVEEKEETVRFTIDIPIALHAKIKSFCALKRVKMKDEIQTLLDEHFKND